MNASVPAHATGRGIVLIVSGLALFCILFALIDTAYYQFANARFPAVNDSAGLATAWGLVSRLHVFLPALALVLWRPRRFGFQGGRTRQRWRLLLVLLLVNCGVIAAYLVLTQGSTPYSGNQWLVTEVIIVPVVEETVWRGVVFSLLYLALRRLYPERTAGWWALVLSGVTFGLMHGLNALTGAPIAFVVPQVLNATLWGLVYGYARWKTDSVYPPMLLHAAMNLVVVLF